MSDNNPYSTPQGEIRPVSEITKGSPVKAVTMGLLVDIGGSLLFGLAFGFVFAVVNITRGVPADQIEGLYAQLSPWSGPGLLATLAGMLLSLLGGYVCARIVKENEFRVAAVMAALSAGIAFWAVSGQYGLLENAALSAGTVLAILAGAALARKKTESDKAALG